MDQKQIQDTKKKLLEINAIVTELDPAIRSAAFDLLAPLYFRDTGEPTPPKKLRKEKKRAVQVKHSNDPGEFFEAFTHDKPNDNVHLIVAWLYSQYGLFPITSKDVRDLADETGLTIPERPDKTMNVAKRDKKKLYRRHGTGWQLTVHGEAYLKKNYSVKKGSKSRPAESNQ